MLENVPTGHGRNVLKSVLLVGICLNPEPNKAEVTASISFSSFLRLSKMTVSASDPREFLGKK